MEENDFMREVENYLENIGIKTEANLFWKGFNVDEIEGVYYCYYEECKISVDWHKGFIYCKVKGDKLSFTFEEGFTV